MLYRYRTKPSEAAPKILVIRWSTIWLGMSFRRIQLNTRENNANLNNFNDNFCTIKLCSIYQNIPSSFLSMVAMMTIMMQAEKTLLVRGILGELRVGKAPARIPRQATFNIDILLLCCPPINYSSYSCVSL